MFGQHIFNQNVKQKNNFLVISGSSLHFFMTDKMFSVKRIHDIFQIRGEKVHRQQDSLKPIS